MKPSYLSNKILHWYNAVKRDLPWRETSDPYKIWISEVILQQTRIDQGLNYYLRFIERFQNTRQLADADQDEVLKYWQGLGYYSRARNLHFGAKQIVKEYDLGFPNTFIELKKVKGIGDYTAAAIASIAFGEAVPAIDGNVFRVLSRLFNIETPIDTAAGKKEFHQLSWQLIDVKHAGNYNQAVMEFGAIQCKPRNPHCESCIFLNTCEAYRLNKIENLPVKKGKTKQRNRFFYYIIVQTPHSIYFNKRLEKDIWQNLYDFPLIETSQKEEIETVLQTTEWNNLFGKSSITIEKISNEIVHILSHQKIHVRFIHVNLKSENNFNSNFIKMQKRNIFDLAVPRVIENYLGALFLKNGDSTEKSSS